MTQTNQLKTYYILSNATVFSSLPIDDLLALLESSLNIPKLHLDKSGDYEGDIVYISHCLGFEILFAKDEENLNRYHLAVHTDSDAFDFCNVISTNLNWDDSLIALLQEACPSLEVRERRPEDDPD